MKRIISISLLFVTIMAVFFVYGEVFLVIPISILRFLPTFCMLTIEIFAIVLIFKAKKWSRGKITKIILLFLLYIIIQSIGIGVNLLGLIPICYFAFSFLLVRIATTANNFDTILNKRFIVYFIVVALGIVLFKPVVDEMYSDFDGLIGDNRIFYALLCFPWIVMIKKKWLRNLAIISLVVLSVLSLKRSASIIVIMSLMVYLYFEFLVNTKHKVAYLLFIISAMTITYYVVSANEYVQNVISRFENISEDSGSGREDIFEHVIEQIEKESVVNLILGNGYNSVREVLSISAHNDFLEVMYDYGLVGLILYVLLHLFVISRCCYLYIVKSYLLMPYIISYIIFLVVSLFSHLIIYPTYFVILLSFWAFVESKVYNKIRK